MEIDNKLTSNAECQVKTSVEDKLSKYCEKRFVVQCDWIVALRDSTSSFFVGIREANSAETKFFDVKTTRMIDEYAFFSLPQDPSSNAEVSIRLDDMNHLIVSHEGSEVVFIPPISELYVSGLTQAPHSMDASSVGSTFISADTAGGLVISAAADGKLLKILKGHAMDVNMCRYFPSGLVAISAGMDMTIRIWALDSGTCVRVLKGHTQAVTSIAVIGVGQEVLSASNDGSVIKWNCGSGEIVDEWCLNRGRCVAMAFCQESSKAAVVCDSKWLVIIDTNGEGKQNLKELKLRDQPTAVCFGSAKIGNEFVFVGFESGVSVYNVDTNLELASFTTSRGAATCMQSYTDYLIISFMDGSLAAYIFPIWFERRSLHPTYEFSGPDCVPAYEFFIQTECFLYVLEIRSFESTQS